MNQITQCISVAKLILRELRTLNETVQAGFEGLRKTEKNPPAPQTDQDADNKNACIQGAISPVLGSKVDSPPAQPREEIPSEKTRDGWDYAKMVAEFIGLAFLIAYTIYTASIYRANRRAAEAAKSAADTAASQLELLDRPWLKISFTPDDITFRDGTMGIGVSPHITNVGHSVATGVTIPIKIFLASKADDFFKEPMKRQKALCDSLAVAPVAVKDTERQIAIFANDTNSSLLLGGGFSRQEIEATPTVIPNSPIKRLAPIMVGCVDYQYDTSKRHHQTRFIYNIFQSGVRPNTTIEVGKDVPAKNVILAPYPFGGFMAN